MESTQRKSRRLAGLDFAPQSPDAVPTDEIHTSGAGKQAVLDGLSACGRRRHAHALGVKIDRILERKATLVEADVDERTRRHSESGTVLTVTLCRRQESWGAFLCQIGGIARPAFGHGSAAQHGNTRGAIHCRDLANARSRARGEPVLDMVAEAAV